MLRPLLLVVSIGLLSPNPLGAQDDAKKAVVTITADGKDVELAVTARTRLMDGAGAALEKGLNDERFKEGAAVMFRAEEREGRAVLAGLRLGDGAQRPREGPANPRYGPDQPTDGQPVLTFQFFDRNRDGKISRQEIADAVRLLGRLDRNDDGHLDRQELTQATRRGGRPGEIITPAAKGERHSDTLAVGDEAPDFTLPSPDGKSEVRLSSFRGKRPVVLVFTSFT